MASKEEFISTLTALLKTYTDYIPEFADNPQVRVNPATKSVTLENGAGFLDEIAMSDEEIEDAAAAENAAEVEATSEIVDDIPDFYPVKQFVRTEGNKQEVDINAVIALADRYFK